MSKYARDLDENLVQKVKLVSDELGLKDVGINVEALRLKKAKNCVGEVLKPNDYVKLYTGEDTIGVALYEEAFDSVDAQTQQVWIEMIMSQISYEYDKEGNTKIKIIKPELNVSMSMFHRYGNEIFEKAELAVLTMEQLVEKEKEEKELKKAQKKNKE